MKRIPSILLLILLLTSFKISAAQELDAKVEVLSDKIQNVDQKVFQSLKRNLTEFLNSRRWTSDNFQVSERIECNFLLTLESVNNDVYKASLTVQSSRPVYNSGYNSPLINYVDRDVVFKYVESQLITFDDNRISGSNALESNLPAVFAYYVYMILGIDYDTFEPNGGAGFLKQAQNIVSNAPEEGKQITGWKATEGNRNRYWLIDQMLSPRFKDFMDFYYTYHRLGLDEMSQKPEEARKTILEGIQTLSRINDENPSSILYQFYFNAKTNEYVNILAQTTPDNRKEYVQELSKMDVPGSAKYRTIR